MGNHKIIFLISLIGLLLFSCVNKGTSNEELRAELESLREECGMLRKDRAKALAYNNHAQQLIDDIFTSLNLISGRIIDLERRPDEMNASIKAEEIANDISKIQDRLSRAEQLEKYDESTQIIISKLKATVEQKQKEINELKIIIQEQKEQINNLDNQVTTLDNSLTQSNQKLKESNAALANTKEQLHKNEITSWINMGDMLISVAEFLPIVNGHKDKRRIKEAKRKILLNAKACYQEAQKLGSLDVSSKIEEVEGLLK